MAKKFESLQIVKKELSIKMEAKFNKFSMTFQEMQQIQNNKLHKETLQRQEQQKSESFKNQAKYKEQLDMER